MPGFFLPVLNGKNSLDRNWTFSLTLFQNNRTQFYYVSILFSVITSARNLMSFFHSNGRKTDVSQCNVVKTSVKIRIGITNLTRCRGGLQTAPGYVGCSVGCGCVVKDVVDW